MTAPSKLKRQQNAISQPRGENEESSPFGKLARELRNLLEAGYQATELSERIGPLMDVIRKDPYLRTRKRPAGEILRHAGYRINSTLTIRLPRELHALLIKEAHRQELSLNRLCRLTLEAVVTDH